MYRDKLNKDYKVNAMKPRFYPSITSLRCFVTAAKYQSFTKAANVLNMTQGAVSKQILHLEQNLNFLLFERTISGLKLTSHAVDYFKQCESILNQIEFSVYQLNTFQTEKSNLKIVAHPSLCTRWLLPKLYHFKQAYPDIRLDITEQIDSEEIHIPYVDFAFLYGSGNWKNMQSLKLFEEECIAVASPFLVTKTFETLKHFEKFNLIHLQARINAWDEYFGLQKTSLEISDTQSTYLDSFNACIEAAKLGYGIALVPKFFILNELNSKKLIQVWPHVMSTQQAYYLCYDKNIAFNSPNQKLVSWFQTQ